MSTTREAFAFQWGTETDDEAPTIESAVFQALGAASMAWDETPAGVFDSDWAKEIGDALIAFIAEKQPMLGYATTHQLIDELKARAEVSETIGEAWPKYRTMDSTG